MSSSKLPAGYHTVTPTLVVRDAAAAIDFYERAFGAEEVNRMAGPDGKIMHAEIRIGDSLVMLGEENEQWGTKSPLLTNGNPGSLHIYVDECRRVVRSCAQGWRDGEVSAGGCLLG